MNELLKFKKGCVNVNNNWMNVLNDISKNINLFGKRKTSKKGIMLASFLGLGMSAAAYRIGKSQNQTNQSDRLQGLMDNFQKSKNISLPNVAFAEFAKELTPKVEDAAFSKQNTKNEEFSESLPTSDSQPKKEDFDDFVI